MPEPINTKPEAAVPTGAAVSSASSPTDQSAGKLARAILLSLFVCPGFGHRHMGRVTAFWVVLGLFLISFITLGYSINQLVQNVVAQMQTHGSADPFAVITRVETACKNAPEVSWALQFLLIVYVGAPVELVLTWLKTRKS